VLYLHKLRSGPRLPPSGLANRPEVTGGEIEPSTIGHAPAMMRGLLFFDAVDLIEAPWSSKSRYVKLHSSLARNPWGFGILIAIILIMNNFEPD
jgi:hypothetical protein